MARHHVRIVPPGAIGYDGSAMRFTALIVASAVLGLAGCAARQPGPAPMTAVASGPVIVELEGVRERVTVTASPDGPRYTVVAADGTVLLASESEAVLSFRYPELHERIKCAIAGKTWADLEAE